MISVDADGSGDPEIALGVVLPSLETVNTLSN